MTVGALDRTRRAGRVGRIQALLWRRPWMRGALLLGPGLTWFVVIYLASLVLLLITAFWQINPFTTAIERVWNIDNFRTLVTDGTYRLIILRTIGLAVAVTLTDALLAFMIIPTYAAVGRIPQSFLEAAAGLGARQGRTTWDVILPLALPGIVAGSIFTFSLTLGDYVTPLLVGGAGSSFIGNVVYGNVGIAHNIPFAAALAVVPVAVMALYLLGARRLGAFEAM